MTELRDLLTFGEGFGGKDGPPPGDPPSPERSGGGFSIGEVLWAILDRWPVVVGVALVFSTLGVFAVLKKFKPNYGAESVLYVRPTVPNLAYTGEEWRAESIVGFYGDYVRTLKAIAVEREVLDEAITRLETEGVEWLPDGVTRYDAPNHLRSRLQVQHVRDSYLLKIGIEDGKPHLPAVIVNAVTDVFLETLEVEGNAGADRRLGTLRREKKRLEETLEQNQEELEGLSADTGVAVLDEDQNVFYERLIRLQDGVTDVFVERVRAEGEYQEQVALAEILRSELPEGEVSRLVDEDTALQDARLMFQRLARDLEQETGDLSGEHPLRTQALARLTAARRSLEKMEADTRERIGRRLATERAEEADRLVEGASLRLESARRSEERMNEVVREAEAELERYGRAVQRGKALYAEGDRLLASIDRVDARIEQLVVESKAPGRVSLRSAAFVPTKPVKDRRALLCIVAVVGSAFAGVVAAFALSQLPRLKALLKRPDPDPAPRPEFGRDDEEPPTAISA